MFPKFRYQLTICCKAFAVLGFTFLYIASSAQSVDLLTGRANVSVPLYTIEYGGVAIPISMWHHGSSVMVEEGEGSCGIGWNLSVGGSVHRQVRSLPDDYQKEDDDRSGWLFGQNAISVSNFSPSSDDTLTSCSDETNDYDYINGRGYTLDTEPDLFRFSAPGLSGEFVFDASGTPRLLSWQDLNFTVDQNANGQITKFTIITNLGMKYEFGQTDVITRLTRKGTPIAVRFFRSARFYYMKEISYATTWYLTKITNTATGISATFSYGNKGESIGNSYVASIQSSTNQQDTLYYLRDKYIGKQLNRVTLGAYTAKLSWGNGVLNAFTVETTGFSEKVGFDFIYRGFRSSTDNTPSVVRYFLKEIVEKNSCQPSPEYSFEYQSVNMTGSGGMEGAIPTVVFPWETLRQQDFWGQYNAQSANKNVPKVYYYASESNETRFRIETLSGPTLTETLTGDNRSVTSSSANFGALKAINYPRGGRTEFTYEANTYYDASDNASHTGPGFRVTKVVIYGGGAAYGKATGDTSGEFSIQRDYEYKKIDGSTSGLLTYPAVFTIATNDTLARADQLLGQPSEVLYGRVIEKIRGKGSVVYEYDLPCMYPCSTGTWTRIARSTCTSNPGKMKTGRYTFPFAPHTNVERGFLRKVSNFDSAGVLTGQRRLNYGTLSVSNLDVYGLRFERLAYGFHFSKYTVSTGKTKVLLQEVVVDIGEEGVADSSVVTTSYYYNSNDLMDSIRTVDAHGTAVTERIRYAKNYAALTYLSPTDPASIALRELNMTNRHGEVIERTRRMQAGGGSYTVTGSSLTLYKVFGTRTLPWQTLSFPQLSGFSSTKISGNNLSIHQGYRLLSTVEEYDAAGRAVSITDEKKNATALWTRDNYVLVPGASVSNAKKSQCAYEGFEFLSGQGFGNGTAEAWTGENGRNLTSSSPATSSTIQKKGTQYKVSCMVKGSSQTTLTFKAVAGGADVSGSTVTLSYTSGMVNTWVYLEGVMNVASAPASFQTQLSSTAAVIVDDIISIPAMASISIVTSKPFVGILSRTDNRGNTDRVTYDSQGRQVNTFDRKNNLVENREYLVSRPLGLPRSPGFKLSSSNSHKVGVESKFSALLNDCVPYTYTWSITNRLGTVVATSSDSTITYAFAGPGQHNVRLTINSATYGSKVWEEAICVDYDDPAFGLKLLGNTSSIIYSCDLNPSRTFSVYKLPNGVHPPQSDSYRTVSFAWFTRPNSGSAWTVVPNATSGSLTYSHTGAYQMKCEITFSYFISLELNDPHCNASPATGFQATRSMSYIVNSPCP